MREQVYVRYALFDKIPFKAGRLIPSFSPGAQQVAGKRELILVLDQVKCFPALRKKTFEVERMMISMIRLVLEEGPIDFVGE